MIKKDKFHALFKYKLLLLLIAIAAATIVLAILFQPIFILVTGIGLPAACIVGIIFFLTYIPPPPKPTKVQIRAEPKEVVADGKSKSFITIQLLDKKGKPIVATKDTEVKLTTTGGKLESAVVKIPKGEEKAETVLISSTETGKIDLSADASGLKSIDIKLNFSEKPRFCMYCGAKYFLSNFVSEEIKCPKCGEPPPPGGKRTKKCAVKDCETVLPMEAKYCSECGARQPE